MAELLQIQFQGVNEGDDPKNLPPGTLLRAENQQMDKARRLVKRHGTQGLVKTATSGSNVAAGARLLSTANGTAMTDGQTVWAYSESLAKWAPVDRIPNWRVTKRPLADSTRSVASVDVAIYGDMVIALYIAQNLPFYEVSSLSTGACIVPATAVGYTGCFYPRVLVSGTSAYFVLIQDVGTVVCKSLDLTTLVLSASHVLANNADTTPKAMDAVIGTPTAGVPTLYVAYELASGTNRTRIASFTLSTFAAITTLDSLGTSLFCVCLTFGALSQKVTLAYSSGTSSTTKLTSCTTALASQVGPTAIYAGISNYVFVAEDDATNVLAGWTRNDGSGTDADRLTTALYSVAAHAIVTASRRITFGLYSPTKPWKTSSRWCVGAMTWVHPYSATATDPIAQPSTVVLEVETAASLTGLQDATHPHVATLENQTGWYNTAQTQPAADASGNVWLASPYRNREPDNYQSQLPVGWSLYELTASGGDTFRGAPLGAAALCAGGAPAWFDGARTMPYGFAHAPQIISVTAAAGGAIVAGVYSYVATYAWRDAAGALHRSMPSAPLTGATAAANLSLIVKVATSSVSAKQRTLTSTAAANPVLIELWRTTIGGTGSHYLLTLAPSFVLVSDPRAGDVSFTDTKADASITGGAPAVLLDAQQQLYTDLGELENVPPPPFITGTTHRGRLVGIGPDLRTVWLSKDSTLDTTLAPGFNEALTLAFSHDKTALASLDTTLVVFGEDTIDVVQGDGPDDKGDQNTWQILPVQTDVGCVEPRSVVTSPMGVVFLSRRGLELLDRGLGVSEILGRNVIDTLVTYPTITSGVLVAAQNEIRFTCDNGTTGIVLAYDYLNKIWFTRKYTDASDTAGASIRFVDAALINGVYTLLTAGGQVYRESATSYLDGLTTYVATDTLLAPISAQPGRSGWSNNNLAWQRAKDLTIMGTSVANHDLAVSFAQDYSATFSQTHTFLANTTGTPTTVGPLEKARVTVAVQKCQSIQIRIRDLTPTGQAIANTSAGVILESLALRVGAKDGPAKTSAGQQG